MRVIRVLLCIISLLVLFTVAGCNTYYNSTDISDPLETSTSATVPTESVCTESLPSKPLEPETFDVTMSFAGDCMLASYKGDMSPNSLNGYAQSKSPEYFMEKVAHIFKADDYTLVNLENVISDNNLSPANKEGERVFWFKGPSKNLDILTYASINAVSLDNNHIRDYGDIGYADTIESLKKAGISWSNRYHIEYYTKNGFTVAFICGGLWSEYQVKTLESLLKEAQNKSDYQVIFFHGGTEGLHKPEEWKTRACHRLVDAGADLVLGCHPHVLQPLEVYNGIDIVYSLGNFCYGGHSKPENATIIYQMKLTIAEDAKEVTNSERNIMPCYVFTGKRNNYQPTPMDKDSVNYSKVMNFMFGITDSPV